MSREVRVLIVDDEPPIRRFLRASLNAHGYAVVEAETGDEALRFAATARPDVVILDLGLPDMDGMDVIRRLREWSDVPILVLSVRERESDKVQALDAGADDYVTKPFAMGELLARIRAALRYRLLSETPEPVCRTGTLAVDFARRLVFVRDEEVHLTPTEYDLLRVLATHLGKVVTHRQLLQTVWGPGHVHDDHYLRVFMRQLRRKIEANPSQPEFILTEAGVGYRLQEIEAP